MSQTDHQLFWPKAYHISVGQKQIETLQTKISAQESYNIRIGSANISSVGDIKLFQNSPNPFDQNTIIAYTIPESVMAESIIIFDMQGTQIKKIDNLSRGNSQILLNGGEFNSGMYLYSLIADGVEIDTKRMILTK